MRAATTGAAGELAAGAAGERSWVEVDLAAIAHNTAAMAAFAAGSLLCAVVKADGYGHGAVPVARTALGAGASWLAVAHAAEAVPLRAAGLEAPILLLTEPTPLELSTVVEAELSVAVYRAEGLAEVGRAARAAGRTVAVHLKVDTGMRRVGCRPDELVALAAAADRHPHLRLDGVMTHCAAADEPAHPATARQLERFAAALAELDRVGLRPPLAHAANSAATVTHPASHHDLVRVGIALYGLAPSPALRDAAPLRPALSLHARVAQVKAGQRGDGVSYGHRYLLPADTTLATLSIGYADGVRRTLGLRNAPVLVGGRRAAMVGVVTMDQLIVDCGPGAPVDVGDEAVLIGAAGDDRVTVDDWAELLDTIGYEVVTGLGSRLPRRYRC